MIMNQSGIFSIAKRWMYGPNLAAIVTHVHCTLTAKLENGSSAACEREGSVISEHSLSSLQFTLLCDPDRITIELRPTG